MKLEIKGFKKRIKNFFKGIALHPFVSFWLILIIAFLVGGGVYYKCVILIPDKDEGAINKQVNFNQKVYEEVLAQWEEREKEFSQAEEKEYYNPFVGIGIVSTSTDEESTSTEENSTSTDENNGDENPEETDRLLAAKSLFTFYYLKGEKLPLISERAIIWEEKGLGSRSEYSGLKYQNQILLDALKEELTN
jgi:hypothetical protein